MNTAENHTPDITNRLWLAPEERKPNPKGKLMKLIAATALAVLFACPAFAGPSQRPTTIRCGASEVVEQNLSGYFGELVIAEGVDGAGNVIRFWVNPETGTFTVTVILDGDSCGLAAGVEFTPKSFVSKDGDPA